MSETKIVADRVSDTIEFEFNELALGDGAIGTPSLAFKNDQNTGLYRGGEDILRLVAGGNYGISLAAASLSLYAANEMQWQITDGFLISQNSAVIKNADGAVGTPSYTFADSPSSGLYRYTSSGAVRIAVAGQLGLSVATTANSFYASDEMQWQITDGFLTSQNDAIIKNADGVVGAPAYSFSSDTDTGIYLNTAGNVGFAAAGQMVLRYNVNGLAINVDGSSSTPAIRWESDADTGIYRAASDHLAIVAGGGSKLEILSTHILSQVKHMFQDGDAATPGIMFESDQNTGIYRQGTDVMGFTTSGLSRFVIGTSSIQPKNPIWALDGSAASPFYTFGSDNDTGIYRVGSDEIGLSCGTNVRFIVGTTYNISYTDLIPSSDNALTLGKIAGGNNRWADVRSVLINGADYGFANGWVLREYPCTAEDVQSKSPDWMKENADRGIQFLNKEGDVVMVIGKSGTLYVKDIQKVSSFVGLEE